MFGKAKEASYQARWDKLQLQRDELGHEISDSIDGVSDQIEALTAERARLAKLHMEVAV